MPGQPAQRCFVTGGYVTARLRSVSLLGACAGGQPLAGTVEACFDDAACGAIGLDSDLEGLPFTLPLAPGCMGGVNDGHTAIVETVIMAEWGGVFVIKSHAAAMEGETVPIEDAFIVMPTSSTDPGAVLCAGPGSTITYAPNSPVPTSAHLASVSRIGACPPPDGEGDGAVDFCMNQKE